MERKDYAVIEQFMHTCMKDSAHDREHVYRVLYNAMEIARNEDNVAYDVLIAAALLHDVSRAEQLADPAVDHALHGADKAHAFLLSEGYPEAFCDHVRQCIRTHRFRKSEQPASVEAKILYDADKLDVAGAIGIARTLEYNGATGRPIYYRDESGRVSDGSMDVQDSFCREYRFKLENIYDRFLTKSGTELAAARRNAAVDFYCALMKEVQGSSGMSALNDYLTNA